MKSLEEFGGLPQFPGILHPAMAHHWRVTIGNFKPLLTVQATKCLINMKKFEITLTVEQPGPHAQDLLNQIGSLSKFTHDIVIDLLDGNEGVIGQIRGYADLIDHEFLLDYSMTGVATHTLVFKYQPTAL